MKVYVVAVDKKEAEALLKDGIAVHSSRKAAERHLKEIKAPPTDPYYGNKYRIWPIQVVD